MYISGVSAFSFRTEIALNICSPHDMILEDLREKNWKEIVKGSNFGEDERRWKMSGSYWT